MSMLDIAKYLYYARSIDLSEDEERYFSLSDMGGATLYPFLKNTKPKKNFSPACVRGKNAEYQRIPVEQGR